MLLVANLVSKVISKQRRLLTRLNESRLLECSTSDNSSAVIVIPFSYIILNLRQTEQIAVKLDFYNINIIDMRSSFY